MNSYPGSVYPNSIFVTGTDTIIGKTFVSAILTLGTGGIYWKPIQSGTWKPAPSGGIESRTDREWIQNVTELPDNHFLPETYFLSQPLSPHASAAIDGIEIHLENINLPSQHSDKFMLIEGAGGIMVPINDQEFVLDIMKKFALPVLLVARSMLGTINHTLLSLAQLRRAGLEVYGIVLNGPLNEGNKQAIEHFGKVRVLAQIEPMHCVSKQNLMNVFDQQFSSYFQTAAYSTHH